MLILTLLLVSTCQVSKQMLDNCYCEALLLLLAGYIKLFNYCISLITLV